MGSGINSGWKQVIVYHYTIAYIDGVNFKNFVFHLIKLCSNISLRVHCVTCELGSSNHAMWRSFNLSSTRDSCGDLNWDYSQLREHVARDPLSPRGEDSPSRPLPARGYGLTNARRSVGHVGRDVVAPPKGSRRRARAWVGPGRDWLGADSDSTSNALQVTLLTQRDTSYSCSPQAVFDQTTLEEGLTGHAVGEEYPRVAAIQQCVHRELYKFSLDFYNQAETALQLVFSPFFQTGTTCVGELTRSTCRVCYQTYRARGFGVALQMASQSRCEANWLTDDISCETHLKVIKLSYTWTIHNFSMRHEETGKKIESSTFSTAGPGNNKWRLELYPNGFSEDIKDYVSLFLRLASSEKENVFAQFKFTVLGEAGQKANILETTNLFVPDSIWGWRKFIARDRLLKGNDSLMPHDNLTIFCEVISFVDSVNISSPNKVTAVNVPECRLSEDFGQLLASRRFSDVILTVGGKDIHAHKNILSARCPVFAAMFEHKMKENNQGRVEITDCDFEIFREVIEFIYTGRASELNKMAEQVLVAADKYDLRRLKAMCEDILCSKLSVETAADMLLLADTHNADQLKANALRFIKANGARVVETDGWKKMATENPHPAVEAFCALVDENSSPKAEREHN
ncbi:hypothetical protein HPB48_016387 [Haemaphysalis longicornis]|uniref:Speckle-type POZ protein n=1 Tax=Haemaphysalis longicornis TaxID=44386 RepID=A0A9J6FP64_HAELO|nr:hypothetical protein HPB48_016387 [Haemaphysalis longicornis]